jgi:hypothetical protein
VTAAVARVGVIGDVVGVCDPSSLRGVSALVEIRMGGTGGAGVDALVGHVDDEGERRRAEAERLVELEIAGRARHERAAARQGPRNDLVGALVQKPRLGSRLDRYDAGILRERGRLGGVQLQELRAECADL